METTVITTFDKALPVFLDRKTQADLNEKIDASNMTKDAKRYIKNELRYTHVPTVKLALLSDGTIQEAKSADRRIWAVLEVIDHGSRIHRVFDSKEEAVAECREVTERAGPNKPLFVEEHEVATKR